MTNPYLTPAQQETLAQWAASEPTRTEKDGKTYVSHPAPPFVPEGKTWIPGLPVLI